jgi:hypothetical protein
VWHIEKVFYFDTKWSRYLVFADLVTASRIKSELINARCWSTSGLKNNTENDCKEIRLQCARHTGLLWLGVFRRSLGPDAWPVCIETSLSPPHIITIILSHPKRVGTGMGLLRKGVPLARLGRPSSFGGLFRRLHFLEEGPRRKAGEEVGTAARGGHAFHAWDGVADIEMGMCLVERSETRWDCLSDACRRWLWGNQGCSLAVLGGSARG